MEIFGCSSFNPVLIVFYIPVLMFQPLPFVDFRYNKTTDISVAITHSI